MDGPLEFSSQAFSKMLMHAMKHPSYTCNGLLLSPKPRDDEDGENEYARGDDDSQEQPSTRTTRIIDAIPISHTSHYLAPNTEIALNSVEMYAQEQELIISGYYQSDRPQEQNCINHFGQRVTEKICESSPSSVLCFVNLDGGGNGQTMIELLHLIDGKWRRRPPNSYSVENEQGVLISNVLYTKEKLYRKIVDFDDHFDNIALDWTNAQIGRRIDHLVANTC